MSAGPFLLRFYEADSGETHIIKSQPETAVLSLNGAPNALPAGPATSPFWAEAGKGKTEYGLSPRMIVLRWTGTPPTGYQQNARVKVVVYQASTFNGATILSPATYLGASAEVVGKIPENQYPGI